MEFITNDAQETKDLGKRIGIGLKPGEKAIVIALEGDLGAGKTTFIQGLGEGLGISKRILSPTFILMREYQLDNQDFKDFYHLDLYRLEGNVQEQIRDLGVFDIFSDPQNVIAIEWAEKAKELLPEEHINISFEYQGEEKRKIVVK